MTLIELAARCAQAAGPDRALDGEIDRLLNDRPADHDYDAAENCIWRVDDHSGLCERSDGFARLSFSAKSYTSSLDAALTLVPEGWHIEEFKQGCGTMPVRIALHCWYDIERGAAKTPALALAAAALRARAA